MLNLKVKNKFSSVIELMKLRMVSQILITALVGYYFGLIGDMDTRVLLALLLGTGFLAAAAFAYNQGIEKFVDAKMKRTQNRPVPTERVGRIEALIYGTVWTLSGTVILWIYANPLTAWLGLATVALYAAVYTPMKRYSSLNTLVGAIPGAIPPLMGWVAARGSIGMGGMMLFAILFFWQMPHFLALALMYKQDYSNGGFKMLSVTDPTGQACFNHIILNTIALLLASMLPFFLGYAGIWYGMTAVIMGLLFLWAGIRLYRSQSVAAARSLFFFSLAYLPILLIAIALNRELTTA